MNRISKVIIFPHNGTDTAIKAESSIVLGAKFSLEELALRLSELKWWQGMK